MGAEGVGRTKSARGTIPKPPRDKKHHRRPSLKTQHMRQNKATPARKKYFFPFEESA